MSILTEPSIKTGAAEKLNQGVRKVAHAAGDVLPAAEQLVADSASVVRSELEGLRDAVPGTISRLATNAEELTRRGIERARGAAADARNTALRAGDAAAERIRDDPLKAVLAAAAAGAAATLLVRWLASRGKAD